MTNTPLTAGAFDALFPSGRKDKIIWTAEAIGSRIGCSPDYVRGTLAHIPGSPVMKIGGRYCAHEGDLLAYFRAEPKQT